MKFSYSRLKRKVDQLLLAFMNPLPGSLSTSIYVTTSSLPSNLSKISASGTVMKENKRELFVGRISTALKGPLRVKKRKNSTIIFALS